MCVLCIPDGSAGRAVCIPEGFAGRAVCIPDGSAERAGCVRYSTFGSQPLSIHTLTNFVSVSPLESALTETSRKSIKTRDFKSFRIRSYSTPLRNPLIKKHLHIHGVGGRGPLFGSHHEFPVRTTNRDPGVQASPDDAGTPITHHELRRPGGTEPFVRISYFRLSTMDCQLCSPSQPRVKPVFLGVHPTQ
jgi:hypothetical protein